jgi:acid stress-induced BolA-like protein IbaG/YrbA
MSPISIALRPLPILERGLKTFILSVMEPNEIKTLIETGMPGASVEVDGDGTHFEAVIVSDTFIGKTLLDRHKMVYGVLGDAMKERIHALSLKTYTPQQWEKIK